MKAILLFFCLTSYHLSFGQTVNFSLEGFDNEYELYLQKEENNQFHFFISDKKSKNTKQLEIKTNTKLSKFIDEIISAAREVTPLFYLTTTNPAVHLEIPKESLESIDYVALDLSEEDWVLLLKPHTVYSKKDEEFEEYLKKINDGNSAVVLENPIKVEIFKKEEKFAFVEDGTDALEFSSEDDFLKVVIDKFKEDLKSLIIVEEDFLAVKDLSLKDGDETILEEYLEKIKKAGSGVLLDNISLTEDGSSPEFLAVEILSDGKSESFALKFCSKNFNCLTSQSMKYGVIESVFNNIIKSMSLKELTEVNGEIGEPELSSLYLKVRDYNERKKLSVATKPFRDTISRLVNQIENAEEEFSGSLKLNRNIRMYKKHYTGESNKWGHKIFKRVPTDANESFIAEYATIRFFNNKAKEIVIVGKIKGIDSIDPELEFVVVNNNYSLPLRSFNKSLQTVPIPNTTLQLNYNDIFQYTPFESSFNYSPRDKEYRLEPNDTAKIEQRKLMDYFTAIIFSDFLGLNNNNSNALLQAEARIKIPVYHNNFRNFVGLPFLGADLNLTLLNGFDDDSRFISDVTGVIENNEEIPSTVVIQNFDIIKYNNVNAGINIYIINWEVKNLVSEFSLALGGRYYRTGLNYLDEREGEDLNIKYQLNALSPEAAFNWEIRPQLNFGADLNIAWNRISSNGSVDDVEVRFEEYNGKKNRDALRVFLNLYSKVNPDDSNSGIYARLGGFYNLGIKDFYPQILVGYATNLSSFVNRFNDN